MKEPSPSVPALSGEARAQTTRPFLENWLRSNGLLLGLALAVIAAFVFPQPGSREGILHGSLVSDVGVAVILFLQGLSLAWENVRTALGSWRLHAIIQVFTFVVFPLVGLGFYLFGHRVWPSEPPAIRDGFLFLCVLPSTVSSSVVLTSVARGNTPGALFNAALSNIAGVIVTPLLVHLLMQASGRSAPFGPLLLKICLLTLLPFSIGMLLRRYLKNQVDANKRWINRICNGIILLIVYTAFCDSVENKIWTVYGIGLTLKVLALVVILFTGMSILVYGVCRISRLRRPDAIAAYFCSVKKTLAMGVPLATLIFGQRSDLSLILLPIMFYNPFQLLVNGLIANQLAKESPE
jgi:sodium/bile acid cotransporter 7